MREKVVKKLSQSSCTNIISHEINTTGYCFFNIILHPF